MRRQTAIILGISSGHGDSAAALVVDGRLVAAAEEERFCRIKHFALFPAQAIAYCLAQAGLAPAAVGTVAVARGRFAAWPGKAALALRHPALLRASARSVALRQRRRLGEAEELAAAGLGGARVCRVEHHYAHLLSARILAAEEMALLSFDALGDFTSAALATSAGLGLRILKRVQFPHSLGFFYTALTQYLGFPHFGDEFKVMGLSSYGRPRYAEAMAQLVAPAADGGFRLNLRAFPLARLATAFHLDGGRPCVRQQYDEAVLTAILGVGPRAPGAPVTGEHEDLAASLQLRFEQVAAHALRHLQAATGHRLLGLAGGCAHNSVLVGKVPDLTGFSRVLVAPAAGDAGLAVGAAAAAAGGRAAAPAGGWALLGPEVGPLPQPLPPLPFPVGQRAFADDAALIAWLARELAAGKIVGLARGRMEFGPRALGSRSILCDPRGDDAKARLNSRVKHREAFRPFAASVLVERQGEWFDGAFPSPYMEAVFPVNAARRAQVPAVVHQDHSCRIQSVCRRTQPFFYDLIAAFEGLTGVPMLLNTSFNDSEPVICTAAEALACFSHCDMDHVVVGLAVVSRLGAG